MSRNNSPRQTLELEPMEDEKASKPVSGKAEKSSQFHANTRSGGDRRTGAERREMIRFEDDRRARKDRRPRRTWESGNNL